MAQSFDIIVIGGGQAGLAVIDRLRKRGYQGSIALIGEETHDPYQRPPLTKGFLQGEMSTADLSLGFDLGAFGIEFLRGMPAVEIDRRERRVRLANGIALGFTKLALATGSRAKRVSGPEGPLYLTTLSECLLLQERLPSIQEVIIVGGGFIGLEAAATLRTLGRSVTVIEVQSRLLARSATVPLSNYLQDLHRRNGVGLWLGEDIRLIGAKSVTLSDGTALHADAVIAGIGSLPNDELARRSGLACDKGILVDELGRTSDPDIVAAGDCTRHPNNFAPVSPFRLESVQHALDQAVTAADSLLGEANPYRSLPTFWSDQYDVRIAMAGISYGADELAERGDSSQDSFSVFAWRKGRLISVESVNRPKDQRVARKFIPTEGITPAHVRNEQVDLAEVVKPPPKA